MVVSRLGFSFVNTQLASSINYTDTVMGIPHCLRMYWDIMKLAATAQTPVVKPETDPWTPFNDIR